MHAKLLYKIGQGAVSKELKLYYNTSLLLAVKPSMEVDLG